MIYVFYNNDPLAQDQGGGAEHFRSLHRALRGAGLPYRLVGCRLQAGSASEVTYISRGTNFLRFYLALWLWFWRHRTPSSATTSSTSIATTRRGPSWCSAATVAGS